MPDGRAYKRYVLAAITAVYTLNLVDRGLVSLLLQSIKEDLRLSDTQLGFLTGIAFGLFYATVGVPVARWSDRGNRVTITSLSIGLWGLTVMSCLFVTNYVQLVFARMAAAVGESGCKPPTYSLLGDYFSEPVERTRAMTVYCLSSPFSSLFAFLMGGWLNKLYGWRMTFFIMGLLGLVFAILVRWTIREPRSGAQREVRKEAPIPSVKDVLATLWGQLSCRHLCIALILVYTMALGVTPWYAAFMIRSHGMGTAELGVWFGMIFGLGGIAGIWLGGFTANRWFAYDEPGQMKVNAITAAFVMPCFIVFLLAPHKFQALAALVPLIMAFHFFLGPTYALMQRLVPAGMRATMMAVVMLLANLIGFGLGPQIVGILSDLFRPTLGSESLRYAMLIVSFVALWAGYHFWQVARNIKADLLAVERSSSTAGGDAAPNELPSLARLV